MWAWMEHTRFEDSRDALMEQDPSVCILTTMRRPNCVTEFLTYPHIDSCD